MAPGTAIHYGIFIPCARGEVNRLSGTPRVPRSRAPPAFPLVFLSKEARFPEERPQ